MMPVLKELKSETFITLQEHSLSGYAAVLIQMVVFQSLHVQLLT